MFLSGIVDLADFFKLLADETRLRIVVLLRAGELCVCELCEVLELPQPKVSQQLAKLRDRGLVKDERRGQWVFYRLVLDSPVTEGVIALIAERSAVYPVLAADAVRLQEIPKGCGLCR
ncbi:MAG TPA: metalloregulator ArsR/SmtB family transcription factor [Patescibacteria group bacterium]|nr:metalloregulator ArsR/SmtB family transcription factor [Patescibacteria group bacterium]